MSETIGEFLGNFSSPPGTQGVFPNFSNPKRGLGWNPFSPFIKPPF